MVLLELLVSLLREVCAEDVHPEVIQPLVELIAFKVDFFGRSGINPDSNERVLGLAQGLQLLFNVHDLKMDSIALWLDR